MSAHARLRKRMDITITEHIHCLLSWFSAEVTCIVECWELGLRCQ